MDGSQSANGIDHTEKSDVDGISAFTETNGHPQTNGTFAHDSARMRLNGDMPAVQPKVKSDGGPSQSHPIAITGMAMKLPGGIRTAESFWDFLMEGKDGHCQVPASRYNMNAHHSITRPDMVHTEGGYFLQDDLAKFDAGFFRLRPQLVAALDPQQRLLVEAVWECIENAGETNLGGRNVGCFVGAFGDDWMELAVHDRLDHERNYVCCTQDFCLANQISHLFDFMGPSVTYRTACSSSMMALHHACQAIDAGECEMAVVAGINLILTPTTSTSMSSYGVLSPSGLCKTFDASADGYGRGEAVNAILIKRLDLAMQKEDSVRAVIRATAINSNGTSPMVGVPRPEGQEKVIRMAYQKASIGDLSRTAFFECHGTGTQKGDAAETFVIGKLFEKGMWMGSVKPNFGHSEGASGLTSVIKSVLALEHRTIPPNTHLHQPNPRIPFKSAGLKVPREPVPWPDDCDERVSINCFGVGGSNAHVIIDSASSFGATRPNVNGGQVSDGYKLLLLSASSEESLNRREAQIHEYIREHPQALQDLAYTLGTRRDHLHSRTFLVTNRGSTIQAAQVHLPSETTSRDLLFVFSGQGAQWPSMGKKLLNQLDCFRIDIQRMDEVLQSLEDPPGWKIEDTLSEASDVWAEKAELAQPLCTAVQIGLVNLLLHWGIRPSAVAGHSSGEIAAAYAAGAISLRTAIILSYYRGAATRLQSEPGGMAAVGMSKSDVFPYLTKDVTVACENSPRSVTISGESDKIDEVMKIIASDHPTCLCNRLPVGVAYHSDSMVKVARQYAKLVDPHLSPNESMIPMFSCVTGQKISSPNELNTAYWRQTIESPVLFHQSINALIEEHEDGGTIIEVGVRSLLSGPLNQIFEASGRKSVWTYVPTLLKDKEPMECLLSTAGALYQRHVPLDFAAINGPGKVLTDLPIYPWQHDKQYWYETRVSREWRHAKFPLHPLLGSRSPESSAVEPSWRNRLQVKHVPWLTDHKIDDEIVYPCVGYISMVGEGIRQIAGSSSFSVRELFIKAAMKLKERGVMEIVTNFRPLRLTDSADSTWYEFTISAWDGKNWQKHCSGQAKAGKDVRWTNYPKTAEFTRAIRDVQSSAWFDSLEALGLGLGPSFRRLEDITADPTGYYAAARVSVNGNSEPDDGYTIHPAVIDQGLQLLGVASCNGLSRRMPSMGIPVFIDSIYISDAAEMISLQASFSKGETGLLKSAMGGSVTGRSSGRLAFALEGVKFISFNQPPASPKARIPLGSRLDWKPDIDLLDGKDYLFKSMQRTPYMEVMIKLIVVAMVEFVDRMGISSSTSNFNSEQSQSWAQENSERLKGVLTCFFPDAVDGFSDPISLHSRFIRDLESVAESSEQWVQPIRGYLTKVLDTLDDQASLQELFMDRSGFKSLYEFTATSVDLGYAFSLLGHANPTMAILEINSGTCGTTSGALAALQSDEGIRLFSKYTFASQSSDLLAEADERFGSIDGFTSVLLNSKFPIYAQELSPQSYDLVIIPSDLPEGFGSETLMQDIKPLLAPGGRVLVREVTPPVPFIDYFMGILPAPLTLPRDLQMPSPYPPEFWESELLAAGFMHPEHHTSTMSAYPWSLKQAIMARDAHLEAEKDLVYLLSPSRSHPWVDTARGRFENQGYKVHLTTLEEYLEEESVPEKASVVSLLDLNGPFLEDLSAEKYNSFLQYVSQKRRTLWVTKPSQMNCDEPSSGLITGFSRTVRLEALVEFATFEVDKFDDRAAKALVKVYEKVRQEAVRKRWDPESEFVLQNGIVHIGRFHWLPVEQLAPPSETEGHPMTLAVGKPGSLDSIAWKSQVLPVLGDDDVEIDVHYAGVNFRDIMVTLGAIDGERGLGLEASGVVRRIGAGVKHLQQGDRVTALGTGLFTSRLVASSKLCFPIASDITMEDAATIPVAYATAIYSLLTVGQLERGQSVLIHSACGAVGQAAIHIARTMKAKIYVTVGTPQKVEYLENVLGIPRANIFHSRNTSFVTDVMNATEGQGVDIVLNSLAGELLHVSWNCVAKFGKMVEIGKRDFMGHATMKMEPFGGNRTFVGVDLLQLMLESPIRFQRLCDMFTRLSLRGKIQPIRPVKVFYASEARDAFAYMQRGVHMGKILIRFAGEGATASIPKSMTIASPISFKRDAAYLIVGGLGGIGRAVSNWLVENGARHLLFLSRSGARSPNDQAFLQELRSQGCEPVAVTGSVTNMDDVQRAVAASPMTIAGLIHLGMVLKPAPLLEATYEDWMAVQDPKVKGTWNLHNALGSTKLDFFVVMSSIAALGGSIGQASYASANSYLGSLVRYRRSLGLPAATLDLGAVGDIGCFAHEPRWLANARQWEFQLLNEGQVIDALQTTIRASQAPCGKSGMSASGQVIVGMSTTRMHTDVTLRIPWHDARYRIFANVGRRGQNSAEDSVVEVLKRHLSQAQKTPAILKESRSYDLFLECMGQQMNLKTRTEAERTHLARTSIDSIVMVEVIGYFRRVLGVQISIASLAGATNVGELIQLILEELCQREKDPE